jgi:Rps23 Pro-64 3,4-dihydroxylase Tpa1-like proline 4-hydroxylase
MIHPLNIKKRRQQFLSGKPFPYVIIDNFFKHDVAQNILTELNNFNYKKNNTVRYLSPLENKFACNHYDKFSKNIYKVFHFLNSEVFIKQVQLITGQKKLYADNGLFGAGLHFHGNKGKLNIHQDHSVHPKLNLQRKLNLIIYMSADWKESYGGHLEFWSHNENTNKPKDLAHKIKIKFNRAVLFDTNSNSWHGLPHEIKCKADKVRQSMAVYYLTDLKETSIKRARALFVPSKEQENNKEVLNIIKERSV